jgi:hypothetical protein
MVRELSRSTELLNCLIAFSSKLNDFPHPLWDLGYQLESIEPRILLEDGKVAKPDIQFRKKDNYLLFFDCKDGYAENNQTERYKNMKLADVKSAKITELEDENLGFDLAYFGTSEKEEKLMTSLGEAKSNFPVIILKEGEGKKSVIRNNDAAQFKQDDLNNVFKEVTIENKIPTKFVPFTIDDDNKTIITNLAQHFMSKGKSQFTLEQLINEVFDHVVNFYQRAEVDALKSRIGNLLSDMTRNTDLKNYIKLSSGVYNVDITSPRKFQTGCAKFLSDNNQKKLWVFDGE